MGKKRRIPEVLWRLFKEKAQTLAQTILSLNPHPHNSFLPRPDDPADYKKLLNRCFVVLADEKAPPPPPPPVGGENRFPQSEIVRKTIESMISDLKNKNVRNGTNVLLSAYNKLHRSSPILPLLTTSAWGLLLERVGDELMVYLLKHASIFVPFRKKHQQVAGRPVSDIVFKSQYKPVLQRQNIPTVARGSEKKRSLINNDTFFCLMFKRQKLCNGDSFMGDECDQMSLPAVDGSGDVNYEGHSNEAVQGLNQITMQPKKRSRAFRWQRCRKRRHLDAKETGDEGFNMNQGGSPKRLKQECNSNASSHCRGKMSLQCSCCLVLRGPHLGMKGILINRQPMFYNWEPSLSVLPRNHILYRLNPNFDDSKSLIQDIFGLSDGSSIIGSACKYRSLVRLVKLLIRQTRRCKHLRLLDRHCCASALNESTLQNSNSMFEENDEQALERVDPQIMTLESYCSKSEVVSFIWAVCRNFIPPEFLGSPYNWRILRKNIYKFISLRKFEKFSLKQCMHKLKTSGFPFLSDTHSSCWLDARMLNNASGQGADVQKGLDSATNLKHIVLQKWIFWFFSSLVVPVVQANFYVTESQHGKHEMYYYKKSTWNKLRNKSIACLKDENYQYLDDASVRSMIEHRSFGFSKLRLLPKKNGVRMLANLKASSRMPAKESISGVCLSGMQGKEKEYTSGVHLSGTWRKANFCTKPVKFENFKSVNCVLRDTHAVLKGILVKEPKNLGSSVFNYNDIYQKLCPFIINLKRGLTMVPDVFIVVSDVTKAFDSIDQDKLLSVMKGVIYEDGYFLKQFHQVVCTKKSLWVHEHLMSRDQHINTGFTRLSSSVLFGSLHTVLVNQERGKFLTKQQLLSNLTEHVKHNVLQFDKTFYLQGKGIPQGSILSSLLCSLYYGHLEKNVIFPFLEESSKHCSPKAPAARNSSEDKVVSSPRYMLLRLIDDFLFISTSKNQASSFFSQLERGFPDYNCYMNKEKFCLNFDIGHLSSLKSNKLYVGEDGVSFLRWSGLLLNSCTLEVQADYMRYLNNHLKSSLTVCWQGKPCHRLEKKLCSFMRPKCQAILFDSNINSAPVVRLNIYQAFLLCAMKFHSYVSDMSYICKPSTRFCLKIIDKSLRYMFVLIKKRMRSMHLGTDFHPVLQLEEGEVEWLGLNAFIRVLKKKQSRHTKLLSQLRLKLSAHRLGVSPSSQLRYAVDSSHSSLIWKIKY